MARICIATSGVHEPLGAPCLPDPAATRRCIVELTLTPHTLFHFRSTRHAQGDQGRHEQVGDFMRFARTRTKLGAVEPYSSLFFLAGPANPD